MYFTARKLRIGEDPVRRERAAPIKPAPERIASVRVPLRMALVADVMDREDERTHASEGRRICRSVKQIDISLAHGARQIDERPTQICRRKAKNGPMLEASRKRRLATSSEQNYGAVRRDTGEGIKEPARISSNTARRRIQAAAVESDSHDTGRALRKTQRVRPTCAPGAATSAISMG